MSKNQRFAVVIAIPTVLLVVVLALDKKMEKRKAIHIGRGVL